MNDPILVQKMLRMIQCFYTRSAQNDYRHFQLSADDDIQIYYHNIEDV